MRELDELKLFWYNYSMSFFWFGLKKKKDSYSIVLNVASGSVTGALVHFTEKPGIKVVSYINEPIIFQADISVSRHIELMKSALEKVLKQINPEHQKIQNVYYLLASPWSISQTQTVRLKENKKVKLTDSFLQKLIDRELANSDFTSHNKIIERKIIQIKANGYILNEVSGESASEAEVSVFSTVVPADLLNDIENIVAKYYPGVASVYHSMSLPIFSVIRDLFPNREDFVYLDVSEEMTDIAVVKKGVVISLVSFPFGRNHFVRELAAKTHTAKVVADANLKHVAEKNLNKLASAHLSVHISGIIDKWTTQVVGVFDKFTQNLSMPENIFFITTNDLVFLLKDRLTKAGLEVVGVEARNITSPIQIQDTMFKIGLVFLDKIYKI